MPRPRNKTQVRCVSIYMTETLKLEATAAASLAGKKLTRWICDACEAALKKEEEKPRAVERRDVPTSLELPLGLVQRMEKVCRRFEEKPGKPWSLSNFIIQACQSYIS